MLLFWFGNYEYLLKQPASEKEFQSAWQAYKYLLRGNLDLTNMSVLIDDIGLEQTIDLL